MANLCPQALGLIQLLTSRTLVKGGYGSSGGTGAGAGDMLERTKKKKNRVGKETDLVRGVAHQSGRRAGEKKKPW